MLLNVVLGTRQEMAARASVDALESLNVPSARVRRDGAVAEVPGVRLIGTAPDRAGAVSFVMDGIHPHDIGTIIDHHGVAIRTGHHCAMPAIAQFGLPATARASLGVYNTAEEFDVLVEALEGVKGMFS